MILGGARVRIDPHPELLVPSPSAAVLSAPPQATRESWLLEATARLAASSFAPSGYTVPPIQVSVGYASTGLRSSAIGQCWSRASAEDGLNHVFISPSLDSAYAVIDTLAHELVHAVDDCQHKHGKEFKKIALAIGMQGPMRGASAGPALKKRLEALLDQLPPYPHGRIKSSAKPRVRAAPPRARCSECGYRVSVPKRFLHLGPPMCPVHQSAMEPLGDWEVGSGLAQAIPDPTSVTPPPLVQGSSSG